MCVCVCVCVCGIVGGVASYHVVTRALGSCGPHASVLSRGNDQKTFEQLSYAYSILN